MKVFLIASLFLTLNYASAQNTQIMPFTGLKYTENGVYAKSIEVELDEQTWTSNQLPSESSFKIKLIKPKGFVADEEGYYRPNIRITFFVEAGDTVGHSDNFMGQDPIFDEFSLEDLSLTLGFKTGTPFGNYLLKASFYDQLSDNSIDFQFEIELLENVIPKPVTSHVYSFNSFEGYSVKTNGFSIENVQLGKIDSLTYSDKIIIPISFVTIEIPKKEFLNIETFKVLYYESSASAKPIKTDIKAKSKIIAKKETSTATRLDLMITIPKSIYKKDDFIRFRWDSADSVHTLDCFLKMQ